MKKLFVTRWLVLVSTLILFISGASAEEMKIGSINFDWSGISIIPADQDSNCPKVYTHSLISSAYHHTDSRYVKLPERSYNVIEENHKLIAETAREAFLKGWTVDLKLDDDCDCGEENCRFDEVTIIKPKEDLGRGANPRKLMGQDHYADGRPITLKATDNVGKIDSLEIIDGEMHITAGKEENCPITYVSFITDTDMNGQIHRPNEIEVEAMINIARDAFTLGLPIKLKLDDDCDCGEERCHFYGLSTMAPERKQSVSSDESARQVVQELLEALKPAKSSASDRSLIKGWLRK